MDMPVWFISLSICGAVMAVLTVFARLGVGRVKTALAARGFGQNVLNQVYSVLLPMQVALLGGAMLWLADHEAAVAKYADYLRIAGKLTMIVGLTAMSLRIVNVVSRVFDQRYQPRNADDLRHRQMRTRFQYLERVVDMFIIVVAIATALMSFEEFRRFGGSLLASAGLASVIIGFAAQRSLGNLIAGFQVAFTQPIRLGDVLVVEGEWGTVEEINFTYVVIRIWDQRRLVLPITYVLEKPFQNWTRTSSELLGSVMIQVEFAAPIEAMRAELRRIVEASALWDRRVCVLQVTDANENGLTIRALVSARDSTTSWDLRCEVREKLVTFLNRQSPGSFPSRRVEVNGEPLPGPHFRIHDRPPAADVDPINSQLNSRP